MNKAIKNFLIGMHGGFDETKYKRDFREGFFGVEVCMFPDEKEVDVLVERARKDGFAFGAHYPLIKKDTLYRDPFFLSLDAEEKQRSFEDFENEVSYAAKKGAVYILTHFPKPVIVDRSLDLQYWRFAGDGEWVYADSYPLSLFESNIAAMFEELNGMTDRYNIQIILENDAMSGILSRSSLLVDMLKWYDKIKMCLDLGRLHMQEMIDPSFNALEFAEMMAPYT